MGHTWHCHLCLDTNAGSDTVLQVTALQTLPIVPWEMEFDWHLTNRCNFLCHYCHPQIRVVLNRKSLNEPASTPIAERFNDLGRTLLIHMSGGEPFMFPDFVGLCRLLQRRHYLSLNTNLSRSETVAEWVAEVDPSRVVRVAAALHIEERERIGASVEDFIANYRLLEDNGFPVSALYVLHPDTFHRAAADLERLTQGGVANVEAKVFKGVHQGRLYPDAYTPEERDLIHKLSGSYTHNDSYLSLSGTSPFLNIPCVAGARSFKISVTGDVSRCASVPTPLGNLYEGTFTPSANPEPCTAKRIKVLSQCKAYSFYDGVPQLWK